MIDLWNLAFALITIFVLLEAVALLALARAIGLMQLDARSGSLDARTSAIAVGSAAPRIEGRDAHRNEPLVIDPSSARPWFILFASGSCEPCRVAVERVRRLVDDRLIPATVVVTRGSDEETALIAELAKGLRVLVDDSGAAYAAFQVEQVPFGFHVSGGLVRARGPAATACQLESLIRQVGGPAVETSGRGSLVSITSRPASEEAHP